MNGSADDKKRWAILPPPTPEASAVSEEIHLDPRAGQLREQIRTGKAKESDSPRSGRVAKKQTDPPSGPRSKAAPSKGPEARAVEMRRRYEGSRHSSSIQAIEPSDSDVPTERPTAFSDESALPSSPLSSPRASRPRDQETLPAPDFEDG
ncbi:MAG: hypothetical protein QM793_14690 [Muricomes sp.]